jgi:hypothetical protein
VQYQDEKVIGYRYSYSAAAYFVSRPGSFAQQRLAKNNDSTEISVVVVVIRAALATNTKENTFEKEKASTFASKK